MLTDREIANAVNSQFKNIVIHLKSARASESTDEIARFKSATASSFDMITKALNKKPDAPELQKVAQESAILKNKADQFFQTKSEYVSTNKEMALLFDDMDSLFRKQKGYIFVSKMNLEKFGTKYKNTLAFMDKMLEAPPLRSRFIYQR